MAKWRGREVGQTNRMSLPLEPGEEKILEEQAIHHKKPCTIVVTSARILIYQDPGILTEFPLATVKFKRSKAPEELTPESIVKFRVISEVDGRSADVSWKGTNSYSLLTRVVKTAMSVQKQAQARTPLQEPVEFPADFQPRVLEPPDPRELLLSHPFISSMYHSLVTKEVITGPEFWETFKSDLIARDVDPSFQMAGYPSANFAQISAENSLKANEVRYSLTEQVFTQIFRKKPQVAQAWRRWVWQHQSPEFPKGISPEDEEQFWTEYMRAMDASKTRGHADKKRPAEELGFFAGIKLEDQVAFDSISLLRRLRALPPDVWVGPLHESQVGSGVFNKEELPSLFAKTIDSLNMHSELVLIETGVVPDTTTRCGEQQVVPLPRTRPLEDLVGSPAPRWKELHINDASVRRTVVADDGSSLAAAAGRFAAIVGDYADGFLRVPDAPQLSSKDAGCVLNDMTRERGTDFEAGTDTKGDIRDAMDTARDLRLEQQVLLSQFWRANDGKGPKADKIRDRLREHDAKATDERKRLYSRELKNALFPTYDDMKRLYLKVAELCDPKPAAMPDDPFAFDFFLS
jgi:hypothetical protein